MITFLSNLEVDMKNKVIISFIIITFVFAIFGCGEIDESSYYSITNDKTEKQEPIARFNIKQSKSARNYFRFYSSPSAVATDNELVDRDIKYEWWILSNRVYKNCNEDKSITKKSCFEKHGLYREGKRSGYTASNVGKYKVMLRITDVYGKKDSTIKEFELKAIKPSYLNFSIYKDEMKNIEKDNIVNNFRITLQLDASESYTSKELNKRRDPRSSKLKYRWSVDELRPQIKDGKTTELTFDIYDANFVSGKIDPQHKKAHPPIKIKLCHGSNTITEELAQYKSKEYRRDNSNLYSCIIKKVQIRTYCDKRKILPDNTVRCIKPEYEIYILDQKITPSS